MNDREDFEDELSIQRLRSALHYHDPAAAHRLRARLAGQETIASSHARFRTSIGTWSSLYTARLRLATLVCLVALLIVASGAAVAGSNILNLGRPVNIQSTNAYFPLSGFRRVGLNLRLNGKPELLFMGVQGPVDKISVERWPLVKALEQFGTLSGVRAVERSCSTAAGYSNSLQCSSPTYDLSHAHFSSRYLVFVSKDLIRAIGNHNQRFQRLNSVETAVYKKYVQFHAQPQCFKINASHHVVDYPCSTYADYVMAAINSDALRTLPLIAIGGYVQTVSQDLTPADLTQSIPLTPVPGSLPSMAVTQGLPFATVQHALLIDRDPPGVYTLVEHVNAEANIITALICHADSKRPTSVCNRPVIKTILKYVK
jgi:hypothetical protein